MPVYCFHIEIPPASEASWPAVIGGLSRVSNYTVEYVLSPVRTSVVIYVESTDGEDTVQAAIQSAMPPGVIVHKTTRNTIVSKIESLNEKIVGMRSGTIPTPTSGSKLGND